MERLFSPCTRSRDLVESQGGRVSRESRLRELNLDVSADEFLSAERGFKYADLIAMLANGNTVAWLTPHAAVALADERVLETWSCHLRFNADGEEIYILARSPEHLLEICDVVLRLLAASVVHSVLLRKVGTSGALINAPALAYLMEQCQSLEVLKLDQVALDEDHCRVLGGYSRPGLEIELIHCKLTSAGTSVLVEVLGRNQGPTKLDYCEIDNFVLANGLRGNSCLKSLRPRTSSDPEVRNREVLAIADALKENKGLAILNLWYRRISMSDEAWGAVCDSLKTHPTLEVLHLDSDAFEDPAVLKSRIQALLAMMKMNLSLHTIHLHHRLRRHELFRGSVIPYLETNRLRPRLLAIQKTRPITFRAKVLGRALLAVRTDPNRFWMLLSGNAEVAFPPKNATIAAAAANLPTPAATAATSTTTNVAGVAASVMAALPTTVVTGSLPIAAAAAATSATPPSTASASDPTVAAAANVSTPSAGQKRKERP
jgi:hypothetical protein